MSAVDKLPPADRFLAGDMSYETRVEKRLEAVGGYGNLRYSAEELLSLFRQNLHSVGDHVDLEGGHGFWRQARLLRNGELAELVVLVDNERLAGFGRRGSPEGHLDPRDLVERYLETMRPELDRRQQLLSGLQRERLQAELETVRQTRQNDVATVCGEIEREVREPPPLTPLSVSPFAEPETSEAASPSLEP